MGRTHICRTGRGGISSKLLDEQRSSICSELGKSAMGQQHWPSRGERQDPAIGRVMTGWSQHSAGLDAILKVWIFIYIRECGLLVPKPWFKDLIWDSSQVSDWPLAESMRERDFLIWLLTCCLAVRLEGLPTAWVHAEKYHSSRKLYYPPPSDRSYR